ncbi:pyridoxamine 5'-phosphate oxidase family protein [Azohydromonas aeria]|uniref:pyridoxamine 5'-phosphate oxidase family protein n=1 Tax=Azohydromonas aeria TaxID=2590212 RepID=UPI0012FA39A4|nr:pyridoxamine 5'-phosphate oxidase family protein [Azohydromonas aeria]
MSETFPNTGRPQGDAPFHAGEQALQARVGVLDRMQQIGRRVIRDHMPEEHRELFQKLPFMLLGALDSAQRPWASMLAGEPGFITAPDAYSLRIAALPHAQDALTDAVQAGVQVGLLGIELATRRRNRMNGPVVERGEGYFGVQVQQSFGNCPKYIQARELRLQPETPASGPALVTTGPLAAEAAACIAQADTFFIATAAADAALGSTAANGGVDVSHRGGKPGFVRVTQENGHTVLTSPDFVGNFFFNTLGNLQVNPRAGLLFVDFAQGHLLQLTGEAQVIWEGKELAAFAGARRLLKFRVDEARWRPRAWPLRAASVGYAAQLASTGSWDAMAVAAPGRTLQDLGGAS